MPFDRTYEGLKLGLVVLLEVGEEAFDRTYEGLKPVFPPGQGLSALRL